MRVDVTNVQKEAEVDGAPTEEGVDTSTGGVPVVVVTRKETERVEWVRRPGHSPVPSPPSAVGVHGDGLDHVMSLLFV